MHRPDDTKTTATPPASPGADAGDAAAPARDDGFDIPHRTRDAVPGADGDRNQTTAAQGGQGGYRGQFDGGYAGAGGGLGGGQGAYGTRAHDRDAGSAAGHDGTASKPEHTGSFGSTPGSYGQQGAGQQGYGDPNAGAGPGAPPPRRRPRR